MSEQEKKGGGSGGSMVVVEKTASSRHKPYRPTELQEETATDLHKRSKAPAVPSVAEELKDTTTVNETSDTVERKELDHTVSSEKPTHVSKKLSSNKRRGSSPEELAMVLMDAKKDNIATTPQPIPAQVETIASDVSSPKSAEKTGNKVDDDSITEEIAELRTSDPTKEHSEWTDQPTSSSALKKKEISWKDAEYQSNVQLQDMNVKSQAVLLERKASVGPCFKPNLLYGGRSGITVCVPKKSVRSMKEEFNPIQSVININVSKKLESKSASQVDSQNQKKNPKRNAPEKKENELELDEPRLKFFENLRGKIDNMTSKIRNLLNV